MRKKIILLTLPVFVPLLLFIGCATDRNAVQQKEVPPMTLSEKGLTVTVTYLTEDQLLERFGERNNPFIPPPSALGFNKTVVFELNIKSISEGNVILNKIELQYNDGVDRPKNMFHFENYWEMELSRGDTQKNDLAKIKYVIKQNLLPNELVVGKNLTYAGFIVFQGKLPQYGNFTLYVPVFNKNGEMLNNFKFVFEL